MVDISVIESVFLVVQGQGLNISKILKTGRSTVVAFTVS